MKKILIKRYVHTWKEYSNDKLKKCISFCMLVCVSWQVFTFCLLFYLLQRLPYGRNQNIGNASAFALSLLCKQWLQSRLKEYAFFIITKLLSYVYNQTYNKGSLYEKEDISRQFYHMEVDIWEAPPQKFTIDSACFESKRKISSCTWLKI